MFDKIATEEQRYEELMRLLGTSEVQSEPQEYRKHAKALAEVEPLIERFREYKNVARGIAEAEELRLALQSALARTGRLIAALKQERRQSRVVQTALASLRRLQ